MHKLLRYYSQNRIKVWTIILAIIFVLVLIQVLNNIAKTNNEANNQKKSEEETTSNVVSYSNESKSIITEGSVEKAYQDDFGEIIDEFYTYCINHKPEMAYEMLAPDTKKVLYPTEKQFESLYYREKFEGNKEYSFQSWTRSGDTYIYQVKIFDNMMSTGKRNDEYMEDYVTIVPVEDSYKLNINSYIGRRKINKSNSNELITVEVGVADVYMDYEIYTLRIKNNTEKQIMLDTRKKTNTVYLQDERNNKYESFLYENAEKDLILEPNEAKTIQIKFSDVYNAGIKITSVNFTDIVDYEAYLSGNSDIERRSLKVDL